MWEKRIIKRKYSILANSSNDEVEKVIYKAFEMGQLDSNYYEGAIVSFQGTPLSNFAPCEVTIEAKIFPSVEHAYQWSKFKDIRFEDLSLQLIYKINNFIRELGYDIKVSATIDFENIFTSKDFSPGFIKKFAILLQNLGILRIDWDDVRVEIMASLLIQKFYSNEFKNFLLNTGNKKLIEGNDWNDTFWGVCNGRGRNMLGRLIMSIRENQSKSKLIDTV